MADVGWLTRTRADVPPHDQWLSAREREVLATLRTPKRRDDWRLGRWAAKAALAAARGGAEPEIEILAAADGAPAAFAAGAPIEVGVSFSHRAGRALVVVAEGPSALGCDLEVIEPRSPAFVRQWLRPDERELLAASRGVVGDLAANLLWTAKEAASKARREGLRLDIRRARVDLDALAAAPGAWTPLRVGWEDGPVVRGWWRHDPGWVMSVVSDPAAPGPPRLLDP